MACARAPYLNRRDLQSSTSMDAKSFAQPPQHGWQHAAWRKRVRSAQTRMRGRRRCWHACRCATHLCRAAHALLRQEHSHPRENPVHGLAAARDFTLRPLELPRHDGVAKAHGAPPPPPMPEAERAAEESRRWCCEWRVLRVDRVFRVTAARQTLGP